MKSTSDAPGIPADSKPQYPSLDAAVEIEQQVAPTLTNLLAIKPQATAQLELGLEVAVEPAAASKMLATPSTGDSDQAIPEQESTATAAAPSTLPEEKTVQEKAAQDNKAGDDAASSDTVAGDEVAIASPAQSLAQPSDLSQDAASNAASAGDSEPADSEDEAGKADDTEQEDGVGQEDGVEQDFDRVDANAASDRTQQVLIKREDNHVAVLFPKEGVNANPEVALDFTDSQLWQDLQQRLSGGTVFAKDTPVHLYGQNHLLDTRQLQELDEALGRFDLKLVRIITSRRQTAVAAAMSGYSTDQTKDLPELLSKEVHSPQKIGLAEPLYLQKTIRSGTEIRHPGSVIIMGDLNPGSSVIADGDILIWGRLRGIAHAGAAGQKTSIVMALKLEAPQLRIAGTVARVAAQGKTAPSPEIAYISDNGIRITSAYSFNRSELG